MTGIRDLQFAKINQRMQKEAPIQAMPLDF
jgi:hypothetical protein